MELIGDLTLVLTAALVGGVAAHRAGQPLIVGYIVAGVVVGPFTGGVTVRHVEGIEQLAELGVALLLFSLGLEVSFRELAPVRAVALAGGTLQTVVTIAFGAALAGALGWAWRPGLWFGALIALSSTMIALKTLQAQDRVGTLSSRVMLGMLVVQDLAVVPLMILLPELSRPTGGALRVVVATGRAFALLALTVLVATRVVPRLLALVARWNSRELFLLATTAVALGVGYAAYAFGLSLALGAFIAGLVVNESEYAHQALSDVVPLRDVFGMLFFVSVGMLLDPGVAWRHIGTVAVVIVAVIAGKASIFAAIVRAFGYRRVVPLAVGLTLFQVGEFAFVLARVGLADGAISDEMYAVVLNTTVATMALTPIVSSATPRLYAWVRQPQPELGVEVANLPQGGLGDHVVIAGGGRVGRSIAETLTALGLPSVLIELDDRRAERARGAGLAVIQGDAGHAAVLDAAQLARARTMLVTVPAYTDARAIAEAARRLHPGVPIIARAEGLEAVRELYALGIEEVTSPELEAAVEMTREALVRLAVPADEIQRATAAMRRQRYRRG